MYIKEDARPRRPTRVFRFFGFCLNSWREGEKGTKKARPKPKTPWLMEDGRWQNESRPFIVTVYGRVTVFSRGMGFHIIRSDDYAQQSLYQRRFWLILSRIRVLLQCSGSPSDVMLVVHSGCPNDRFWLGQSRWILRLTHSGRGGRQKGSVWSNMWQTNRVSNNGHFGHIYICARAGQSRWWGRTNVTEAYSITHHIYKKRSQRSRRRDEPRCVSMTSFYHPPLKHPCRAYLISLVAGTATLCILAIPCLPRAGYSRILL